VAIDGDVKVLSSKQSKEGEMLPKIKVIKASRRKL
jgi:hypothetical protein